MGTEKVGPLPTVTQLVNQSKAWVADTEPTLSSKALSSHVAPEKNIPLFALKNQQQHQPAQFSLFHMLCLM